MVTIDINSVQQILQKKVTFGLDFGHIKRRSKKYRNRFVIRKY